MVRILSIKLLNLRYSKSESLPGLGGLDATLIQLKKLVVLAENGNRMRMSTCYASVFTWVGLVH